jgi:hypothetical protein
VATRVERHDSEPIAQQLRNFGPHSLAEAVRVVRQRERARTSEVEQCDLDTAFGESQAAPRRAREQVRDSGHEDKE